jgi:hypothetical protein
MTKYWISAPYVTGEVQVAGPGPSAIITQAPAHWRVWVGVGLWELVSWLRRFYGEGGVVVRKVEEGEVRHGRIE